MKNIDVFIAWSNTEVMSKTVTELSANPMVANISLIHQDAVLDFPLDEKCQWINSDRLTSTKLLRMIAQKANSSYTVLYLKTVPFELGYRCLERMLCAAEDSSAVMVYADRYEKKEGKLLPHPTIDYQEGSVRDDFDFGGLWFLETQAMKSFFSGEKTARLRYSAFYALRLHLSRVGKIFHLNEYLYSEVETDLRNSGEKQFDYVNPANREVQMEYERVCTEHLKFIDAWLAPDEFDHLPNEEEG